MNIIVYDVAASESGALSVLENFYQEALECTCTDVHWTFLVSTPELESFGSVRVLRYPWIKKSWLHRLWFDLHTARRVVKKNSADCVLSLQNIVISRTKVPQVLYVHQPLPFVPLRFSFLQNRLFWFYQNIAGPIIEHSIRKADKTVVQTQWMKQACVRKAKVSTDRIMVIRPGLNRRFTAQYSGSYIDQSQSRRTFFYPASACEYKNHKLILQACKKLKQKGILNYQVVFTLSGKENRYARSLAEFIIAEKLNVTLVGKISQEEVFSRYAESVLLFPSKIETFGLPLLEAKMVNSIIMASDQPFSHEILDDYTNAYFFGSDNVSELTILMEKCINGKIICNHKATENFSAKQKLSDVILEFSDKV